MVRYDYFPNLGSGCIVVIPSGSLGILFWHPPPNGLLNRVRESGAQARRRGTILSWVYCHSKHCIGLPVDESLAIIWRASSRLQQCFSVVFRVIWACRSASVCVVFIRASDLLPVCQVRNFSGVFSQCGVMAPSQRCRFYSHISLFIPAS